jgi:lysophospholipase L1-like esterase
MKRETLAMVILGGALIAGSLFTVYKALDYRSHVNYFLDKYTNVVSEFSGRRVYANDNLRLINEGTSAKRVVFMGDQIVETWDLARYFKGFKAINRGITGQRLSGFILRIRPDALDLRPRAVVIQFSSYNFRPWNSVKEIEDYVMDLTDLISANGIEPILTTVIPVRKGFDYYRSEQFEPYPVADSIMYFNNWLTHFCLDRGYSLIDFHKTLADENGHLPEKLSIDNTHLNEAGFKRLASATNTELADLR